MIIFGQNLEISVIVILALVTQKKSQADWATSLSRDINPIQLPNSLFCVPFQHNIAKMTVFLKVIPCWLNIRVPKCQNHTYQILLSFLHPWHTFEKLESEFQYNIWLHIRHCVLWDPLSVFSMPRRSMAMLISLLCCADANNPLLCPTLSTFVTVCEQVDQKHWYSFRVHTYVLYISMYMLHYVSSCGTRGVTGSGSCVVDGSYHPRLFTYFMDL